MTDENNITLFFEIKETSFKPEYEEGGGLLSLIESGEASLGLHGNMFDAGVEVKFSDGSTEVFNVNGELGGSVEDNGDVKIYSGRVQSDLELKGDKSRKDISDIRVVDYVWDFRIYALTEEEQQKAAAEERFEYSDFEVLSVEIDDEYWEAYNKNVGSTPDLSFTMLYRFSKFLRNISLDSWCSWEVR